MLSDAAMLELQRQVSDEHVAPPDRLDVFEPNPAQRTSQLSLGPERHLPTELTLFVKNVFLGEAVLQLVIVVGNVIAS